jgi:cytoplasmic iron level regulating protein YaaA (DUF328/UPF0246 family)
MPRFSILLAPSEGKKPGGNPFAPDMFDYRSSTTFNYFHELNAERRELIAALHETINSDQDLEALFGVAGRHLEEAVAADLEVLKAPLMSALDRYSPGVMYSAMNFSALPTGAQRRLLENGIILSGLFGLLRPDDLIPNYRLKMDASLPGIGKVSAFWKEHMSDLLNRTVEEMLVWNLLPRAHEDAWSDNHTYAEMVRVRFFKEKKGERTAVTHGVKPLRGQLVNFIVRETVEEFQLLEEWRQPDGYRLDMDSSTYDEETKIRELVFVKRS